MPRTILINRLYLMAAVDVMQGFACDVHAVLIPLAIATLIGLGLSALLPDDAPRVQLQGDHQQHHNLAARQPVAAVSYDIDDVNDCHAGKQASDIDYPGSCLSHDVPPQMMTMPMLRALAYRLL